MFLLESPWPILLVGIAVEAVLAIMLLRTGQGRVLWAMLGVAAVLGLGLVVERLVVTERESIANTLDSAAAAVEANNLDRLLDCIDPAAKKTRSDSRWVLNRVEFSKARIGNLEIKINLLTSPPTAKATFLAIGSGRDRKGEIPFHGFSRTVTANLRKQGDRWLLGDYTVEDLPIAIGGGMPK